jgi:hypothetical protein
MNKKRSLYLWTRKFHLYLGLFIGPHVLIFALSTLYLNHGWRPGAEGRKRTLPVEITEGLDRIEQANRILEQLDRPGELNMARLSPRKSVCGSSPPGRAPGSRRTLTWRLGWPR